MNLNSPIFWNPYLETLDSERLRNMQFKRFKEAVTFAYYRSEPYRQLYESFGITPEMIRSFDDIVKVPVIDKQFMDGHPSSSIYGGMLAVPEEEVVYYHQTSGTTHHPIKQPDTLEDWYWWAECWASVLWAQGVRGTDRVFIAFNYNLFIGFWGAHYGCEKIGAEVISAGGLSTEQRLDKIQELKPTALISTPTYIFRLTEAAEARGIDLRQTSVKRIICAGEPGALIPSVKQELESKWDCHVLDHVGATEVGAWGYECAEKPGGLHINESMFLVELLDLETHEVITEHDKLGYLVITAFHRRGKPCIRFNTKDLGCWQEKPCNCSRTYRILKGGVQGRADHLMKVRGTFVTPAVIEEIIHTEESLNSEYLIVIGEKNKELELMVETVPDLEESEYRLLQERLGERIYNRTSLRFIITLKQQGELPRGELKSKRVIDVRGNLNRD